jgi:hypothetical protein
MARFLSMVEDVFQLSGRSSVVVAPGIPREGDWRLKTGDRLRLRAPNGQETDTIVGGLEMSSPPHPVSIALMLGPKLTTSDVPIGTEIWVLDA